MCTDLTGRGSDSMENTQNTPKRSGGKISYTLQAIGLIPLLALGIVMLFFTSQWFTKTMYQEVERELYDATKSATTLLNAAYPGDYRLEGDVAYLLYKGDVDITREYSLFDQFKEDTGLEINTCLLIFLWKFHLKLILRTLDFLSVFSIRKIFNALRDQVRIIVSFLPF